jgi:hypothetical protein
MERVEGIEPSYAAWEAAVLPLNYTRSGGGLWHEAVGWSFGSRRTWVNVGSDSLEPSLVARGAAIHGRVTVLTDLHQRPPRFA